MEELSIQQLAAEMRIKSSLLAIQDFLGTLKMLITILYNNGNSNRRDMKFQFGEEQVQEEERAPPSMTKFSTPQAYQSPVPMQTTKFNIRRLSSSGGMDNLKRAFISNHDNNDYVEPIAKDTSITQPQQFSSIATTIFIY